MLLSGTKRGVHGAMRREVLLASGLFDMQSVRGNARKRGKVKHTVATAVIEEDLRCFCCVLRNADDVSISTARTAAVERVFVIHRGEL